MSFDMKEALSEFVSETDEILERLSLDLASVEKNDFTSETINSIYRDIHSIKGAAQLFGCTQIGQVAHAIETSLSPVRDGIYRLEPIFIDNIYKGTDLIKTLVRDVQVEGAEKDYGSQINSIVASLVDLTCRFLGADISLYKSVYEKSAEVRVVSNAEQERVEDDFIDFNTYKPDDDITKEAVSVPKVVKKVVQPKASKERIAGAEKDSEATQSANHSVSETIRVGVGLLDNLMNLAGELVLIRNQILQYSSGTNQDELNSLSQRLNIVTSEIQNEVMKTRMQPIGSILSKFQRVVRDLGRELNKNIDIQLSGTETELDKTLIEAIKDPLTHIVRNSADHGIETKEERAKTRKSPTATISIRSYHEGGQVVVEISDDGRGLDKERISEKAVEKGIITREDLSRLNDKAVYNLIFAPGLSTADKVTNVSGRGVGMDVVRSNIEKIGGVIDIDSAPGEGTRVRLKIPLTLAIVSALIVRSGGERFTIPQVKLSELVRVDESDTQQQIEYLQGRPVYRLRGQLLPLIYLHEVLNLESSKDFYRDGFNIVVLNSEEGTFGLIVDDIEDSTDIVVKPLSNVLKNMGVFAGATVMGDGAVALTIDVGGIAEAAHVFNGKKESEITKVSDLDGAKLNNQDAIEYVVVDLGVPGNFLMPLCMVKRLEEFKTDQINLSGQQEVINYRGGVLPIVDTVHELGYREKSKRSMETFTAIVVEKNNVTYGLEVSQIRDVFSIESEVSEEVKDRPGILGNLIHNDTIYVVIDVYRVINSYLKIVEDTDTKETTVDPIIATSRARHKVLYAEDNNFFRKQVIQTLSKAGYAIDSEINGKKAFEKLSNAPSGTYSLLLSDIEMPEMNGFELIESVRKYNEYAQLPAVALTTRYRDKDRKKGQELGFSQYLEKLNGEELVNTLDNLLGIKKGA